ncbi:hypothetical protein BAUCODRAFT_63413 [Baudoinia panamericana UAMH 10762]|uniref:FAD-binding domain-containing protein n=1 Tax=Baudoinia panamericana (strain UAMH 10762) TaxID=717646 RepID=M2MRT6_BAUPA|nr:uncharacterized protein BAUCODRAFT_63413 [Baudoinia panamericana UAMH 10762]EMC99531.1 hypothetical protein BAUCODRAFT_63413 [Baudoinia panamericana UAMH 10762]
MAAINGSHHAERNSPLRVLIVGAGIGGLTAAVALRRQGHDVEIFEQSKLAQETGAAIHLAPNANGLLRRLGLNVENIGGVECVGVIECLPHNNQVKYEVDNTKFAKMWQHAWYLVHRAHLHTALKNMAIDTDGFGKPAKLQVASRVKTVNAQNASIGLEDGTTIQADVVIGADGVHSMARANIPGGDLSPFDSGKSAFRFLIPTDTLASDPMTAGPTSKLGYLTMWIAEDRRVVMYPCSNNTMMNFVAIHPSRESEADVTGEGWQESASKARMLDIYKAFAPEVRAILEKAEDPKVWKLLDMKQMPTFIHEKLAVLGDAAHPFLPHQGQGGAQALEDAVVLAAVLPLGTKPSDIPERLQVYEQCRYERAHRIQNFTREAGLDAAEMATLGKKLDMHEYQAYNFGHDAWDFSTNALRKHLNTKDTALRFRAPIELGASPGPRRPLGLHPQSEALRLLRQSTPERARTYSVKFRTSQTYVQNLLPSGFAFTSPATVVSASLMCTTLSGMTWLGGGGYSHFGLYLHGVNYTKRDGSKVFGTYMPLLFEDLTDPIITGRDEVGMPKLFADIDVRPDGEQGCKILLVWRGVRFGELDICGLTKEQPVVNGVSLEQPHRGPGTPPAPPETGRFHYRYVPTVGEPGKTDAEYAVFVPNAAPEEGAEPPTNFVTKSASFSFDGKDWQSLPTLHHITSWLAAMPCLGVEEGRLTQSVGVTDISNARRLE